MLVVERLVLAILLVPVRRGPKLPDDPWAKGKRTIDVALPVAASAIVANAGPRGQ